LIYLSKILPTLVLPTSIALILLVAGLAFRRRGMCWIGITILWVFSTPLVSTFLLRAAEAWQVRQPASSMPNVDAIVVLSTGRVQPPGDVRVSEWTDADRYYGGIELYKARKAPLLVFTGGWLPWLPDAEPEGDVLMRHAAELGIPPDRMLTTPRVSNTQAEAGAVFGELTKRLGANAPPRVLLVTSAYHMKRAELLFRRAGIDTVPFPVDFKVSVGQRLSALDLIPGAASLSRCETALRELYGLAFYTLVPR
jgi:uncharacterized SAM-binding protein YcdF (DUF218 family)